MEHFMRHIKKLILAFAVALVAFLFVNGTSYASEDADIFRYGRYALSRMEDGEDLVYAYDQLIDVCQGDEAYVPVADGEHDITIEDFYKVFAIFRDDYPEYFWLTGAYSYYSSNGYVTSAMPFYTMTGETLEKAKKDFAAVTADMIEDLEGESDYEKSLLLHDRLAYLVEYDFSENNQNAYGALVENECVCAGYARSYQYLLNQVGIPAWTVTGVSVNPDSGKSEGHAWNMVQIDGQWYYSDVTWDDQGDDADEIYHAYLNVTEEVMEEQHVLNDMYDGVMPEATSMEANYFYRNGGMMDAFDVDTVAGMMKAGDGKARVFVTGDINEFIQMYYENIRQIAKEIGVTGGFSYGYSSMGRELALHITWSQPEKPSHRYSALNPKVEPTCKESGMKAGNNNGF